MKKFLILAIRLVLGAIFLVSAIAKLLSPSAFGSSLTSFGLLPLALVPWFTYLIPTWELVLAFALLLRVQMEKAAVLAAAMMVIFIAAAASASISGAMVENCGCFGELYRSGLGVGFFVRNSLLLLLSVLLFWLSGAETTVNAPSEQHNS